MNHHPVLCALLMPVLLVCPGGLGETPASAPASGKAHENEAICVAVLEAENFAAVDEGSFQPLKAWLDARLTESLSLHRGFAAVDRTALDKVIAEAKAKLAATEVDASLRPFWAAGVILCPTIRMGENKSGSGALVSISLDAVVAQTGQVAGELNLRGTWDRGQWTAAPKLEGLDRFWGEIRRWAGSSAGAPLVEVAQGSLKSSLTRLTWMRDDLDDFIRGAIEADGRADVLVPRHPLFTKEERLLRAVGLAAAQEGDKAAGLVAAADVSVKAELIEDSRPRLTMEKTPLTIRLSWRAGDKTAVSDPIVGTVGDYDSLRGQSLQWIRARLQQLSAHGADAQRDEETCKRLAKEEIDAITRLLEENGYRLGVPHYSTQYALSMQMLRHAMRAAHLDPGNKEAARYVAMMVEGLYYRPGQAGLPRAAYERTVAECTRYIQNFHVSAAGDYLTHFHLSLAARELATLDAGGRERFDNLTLTPMEGAYHYARICAYESMDVCVYMSGRKDQAPGSQAGNLWASALRVRDWLFLNCPLEEMDQELAYWREYWKKNVEPLPGEVPPWEWVLAGYYTRKKDAAALRDTYIALAKKCPDRTSRAWTAAKMDLHLKVAGDPEWETWQPEFSLVPKTYNLDIKQLDAFFCRLNPQTWTQNDFPLRPYENSRLVFPPEMLSTGYRQGQHGSYIEALAITGEEIWFVTPARDGSSHPSQLYVSALADVTDEGRDVYPKPTKVDWPQRRQASSAPEAAPVPAATCCLAAQDGTAQTLWVGTAGSGLARFDRAEGGWRGRWYSGAEGLPVETVSSIAQGLFDGKKQLLIEGQAKAKGYSVKILWVLDPASGDVRILHDGVKTPLPDSIAFSWADGTTIPLPVYDARIFPSRDLKEANIVAFAGGTWRSMIAGDANEGASPRVWRIDSGDSSGEVDARTFKPLGGTKARPHPSDSVFVDERICSGRLRMISRGAWTFSLPGEVNPFSTVRCGAWEDGVFWMIDSRSFQLWGYAPAPPGERDWAHGDEWIGPFRTNGGGLMTSLLADPAGHLFVSSTEWGVDRLDAATLLQTARKENMVASTSGVAARMRKATPPMTWQEKVGRAILEKRFDDALAVVDEQVVAVGILTANSAKDLKDRWTDAMLWQGLIQARAGYLDEACDLYLKVARSPLSDGPAKALARLNRISALYLAKRWQAMLDEVETFSKEFPDLRPAGGPDALPWHIADARKKLEQSATQPSLQPTDTHARPREARAPVTQPAASPAAPAEAVAGRDLTALFPTDKVAAIAAAKKAGASAVRPLAEELKSPDANTRLAAMTLLRILGQLASPVVDDMIAAAAKDTGEVRNEAFMAFGDFGPAAKSAVLLLMAALRDANESPRAARAAAYSIMKIAPDEPGLGDVLVAGLKNKDLTPIVRTAATTALGNMKDPPKSAGPAVIDLLKDPAPDVRRTALGNLRKVVEKEKVPSLIVPMIKDEDKRVRISALVALRDIGPAAREAIPNIVVALKEDPENQVREWAAYALAKMGKAGLSTIPDLKAAKEAATNPRLREVIDIAIRSIERATE